MVFSQVLAAVHAVIDVVGLPGNLLVIATICMESRFHVMRYVLLASLAGSDILFLILGNSPSIASTAHERWLYGETMCKLHYLVLRYFYLNTVLHLIAVSYERYSAIVKSPLTYDSSISTDMDCPFPCRRTLKRIVGLCAILFSSGTDNVIGVHELRLAFTGIPSIEESRAAQVAQHTDSLDSRTLNIPKGTEMNLQRCHQFISKVSMID